MANPKRKNKAGRVYLLDKQVKRKIDYIIWPKASIDSVQKSL